MEESNKKNPEVIDIRIVFRKIWANKRLFYKVLPIVFVLSCIYIFSIPRYYKSDVKLAPELENSGTGGALSSLASSFGLDLSEIQTSDAITPLLYPDLMEDNGFVSNLMTIHVKNQDGDINTTYHDYLKKFQKQAWWNYPIDWLKSLLPKKEDKGGSKNGYDPYNLSKNEDGIFNKARKDIVIGIDKKTGVISIDVKAQDPLICKTLADSIKDKLQVFITDYRTNKARTDYEYYKKLAADAKRDYEKTRQKYSGMSDANTRVVLRSVELKMEDMENDMQLKFNTYTTINTQLQAAKAKVQEKTPAFTLLKGAAVPVKPAGPKRMLFVIAMLLVAIIGTVLYIFVDEIKNLAAQQ
jgi:capsular polysaccharide biosynthesis protein